MEKLPENYPYLEPCPGCFENSLLLLTRKPGSAFFFSNGDFTLNRLLRALGKIVYQGDLLLCTYLFEEETAEYIHSLQLEGYFKEATVFCSKTSVKKNMNVEKYEHIRIVEAEVNTFLIQAYTTQTSVTLSGLFMQGYVSRSLEFYMLCNDMQEQELIRQTVYKRFRKQLDYAGCKK